MVGLAGRVSHSAEPFTATRLRALACRITQV
jgi:hypothetical protein